MQYIRFCDSFLLPIKWMCRETNKEAALTEHMHWQNMNK